jgi:hypothetical protein
LILPDFELNQTVLGGGRITYAKKVEGLQRSLSVQRLVHNWVKPHWG